MILPNLSTHFAFYAWSGHNWEMRRGFIVAAIGAIVTAFGIIFFLQGNSVVGPTTSFMYSNHKWVVNGEWIAISGVIILALGIGISLRHLKS